MNNNKVNFALKIVTGVVLIVIFFNVYANDNSDTKIIHLSYKDSDSIKIPHQTIVFRNGMPGVFVVEKGEARFRMVRLGKKIKESIYILAGLFGNEKILLSNMSILFDGKRVFPAKTELKK